MTFARYIRSILLNQRGQNHKLADEIEQNLSPASQERLFRILQDMERGATIAKRKSQMYGHIAHLYGGR